MVVLSSFPTSWGSDSHNRWISPGGPGQEAAEHGGSTNQGTHFTSWALANRVINAGLLPSMGSVGDRYALMESFWSRVQCELFDRKRQTTRVELATALLGYLAVFHNRQRRHSSLGTMTPVECEPHHGTAAAG